MKKYNPFDSQSKMIFHSDKLSTYVKTGDSTPILLEVNLTSNCPLKCQWCSCSGKRLNENIKTGKLIRFLKQYKEYGKAVTWSGGGEPTAHPDFIKIINSTKIDQGLMTCGVYSSSYNKDIEKNCNWVRFSVDSADRERYARLKGVDTLEQVKKNIAMLDKSKIKVGINMNLPNQSEFNYRKEVYSLFSLAIQLKVHYFQIRPVLPSPETKWTKKYLKEQMEFLESIDNKEINGTKIIISWDKYNDLMLEDNGRDYKKCSGHIFEPIVDSNGDLCVCMYKTKDSDFVFGNIYKQTFRELWSSDKRNLVKLHCDKMNFKKCQICCKCHEINKFIKFIDNKEGDINFI